MYLMRKSHISDDTLYSMPLKHQLLPQLLYCSEKNTRGYYAASSSSSSPDTSAFSCPTFAMSWARSCSSVSETALGW
jgi:hypothetical protein